jgi:murein DD-endopeptidase MepM/ murein hydrolase activator NlpD
MTTVGRQVDVGQPSSMPGRVSSVPLQAEPRPAQAQPSPTAPPTADSQATTPPTADPQPTAEQPTAVQPAEPQPTEPQPTAAQATGVPTAGPRVVGRHRQDQPSRHRAPRSARPRHRAALLPLPGEHGRTAVVAATLGAALVTGVGVAGGTAAAAAQGHSLVDSAPITQSPTALPQVSVDVLLSDQAPAKTMPFHTPPAPHASADLSAAAVQHKARTVVATVRTAAAWVNPNPTAAVTSCFGERWGRLHAGVDLAAADHTPIVAAGAGVIVRAGVAQGYGNAVLIDHGNGYLTHYGHLSEITVRVGQHVATGEQIGLEGSTGHSTGPHLHFEVHRGFYKNPIEPTRWMHEHGVDITGCADLG